MCTWLVWISAWWRSLMHDPHRVVAVEMVEEGRTCRTREGIWLERKTSSTCEGLHESWCCSPTACPCTCARVATLPAAFCTHQTRKAERKRSGAGRQLQLPHAWCTLCCTRGYSGPRRQDRAHMWRYTRGTPPVEEGVEAWAKEVIGHAEVAAAEAATVGVDRETETG